MNRKKLLEIIVYSVNFIVISYALINMQLCFKSNPVYILFFASDFWLISLFYEKLNTIIKNKAAVFIVLGINILILISAVYFFGYIEGSVKHFY